jgi:class 3 adenylate cyclase
MDSDTIDSIDVDGLRQKLVDAERKYYTNLQVLQEKLARLEAFQALNKLLVACTDPLEALDKLVELSIQYMGVEKAIVIQPVASGYEIAALKGYSRRQVGEVQQVVISSEDRHLRRAVDEKKSILLDAVDGELADKLDLSQSIICPLHSEEGFFFGLYIIGFSENKKSLFRPFDPSDVEFFDTIGAQVSALLQNLNLRDSFKRFVPFEFLALLEKTSIQDVNAGDNVSLNMHVMFTDLRDFTLMSESMGPEAVFALLNEYLGVMEPLIASAGGFINQYQGDAIMALFSGESDGAVQGAIRMWEALGTLNKERCKRGEVSLRIGIGINSGELLLGAIGSTKRLDSNVVGDAPNLASRVEGMTKVYGARVLISGSTHAHLSRPADFTFRELDRVIVAGKTEPVEVYELLDVDPEELREQKARSAARFAQGLLCYRAGEFRDARLIFADCLVKAPFDEAAALYIGRCVELIAQPPAGVWDGTTVLSGK